MNYYKVFTKRLAAYLCKQGFFLVKNVPNNEKPWLNVFLFEDTEELRKAVHEYQEAYQKARIGEETAGDNRG